MELPHKELSGTRTSEGSLAGQKLYHPQKLKLAVSEVAHYVGMEQGEKH